MKKQFKLAVDEIKPLASGYGACISSDMITVEGYPVRFMYRESPSEDVDSGWRFWSGFEDEQYMSNHDNLAFYEVNTIANYDPSIIPHLDSPVGSAFEKTAESEQFVQVSDWEPPDESSASYSPGLPTNTERNACRLLVREHAHHLTTVLHQSDLRDVSPCHRPP